MTHCIWRNKPPMPSPFLQGITLCIKQLGARFWAAGLCVETVGLWVEMTGTPAPVVSSAGTAVGSSNLSTGNASSVSAFKASGCWDRSSTKCHCLRWARRKNGPETTARSMAAAQSIGRRHTFSILSTSWAGAAHRSRVLVGKKVVKTLGLVQKEQRSWAFFVWFPLWDMTQVIFARMFWYIFAWFSLPPCGASFKLKAV